MRERLDVESREANSLTTWENNPDSPAWVGDLLQELGKSWAMRLPSPSPTGRRRSCWCSA